jgi:hypothetical protein
MRKILTGSVAAAALMVGLALAPSVANAQLPTKDECGCQSSTGKAQGTFVQSKGKCITKCQVGARKGQNPLSDCSPPYAGATAACVDKAEAKAISTGSKGKCAKDCPECYASGNCPADATTRTASTESQVDAFIPFIYCTPAPTDADEQKCQDTQAGEAAKAAKALATCSAKCRAQECAGKIPPGSCAPPPTDAKTVACRDKAIGKCAAKVDSKCVGNTPACAAFGSGVALCAAVRAAVDSNYGSTYCASPSGAFLE